MKTVINLTPHPVTIGVREIPSTGLARVAVQLSPVGEFDGIPLVSGVYGEVTGLPAAQKGVLIIVSALVRCALPNRKDLASPAKLVRDASGAIMGCEALEVNP